MPGKLCVALKVQAHQHLHPPWCLLEIDLCALD